MPLPLRLLALDQYLQAFELAVGLVRVQEGELDHSTQQAEAFGPMCLRLQQNSRAILLASRQGLNDRAVIDSMVTLVRGAAGQN